MRYSRQPLPTGKGAAFHRNDKDGGAKENGRSWTELSPTAAISGNTEFGKRPFGREMQGFIGASTMKGVVMFMAPKRR